MFSQTQVYPVGALYPELTLKYKLDDPDLAYEHAGIEQSLYNFWEKVAK